MTTISQRIQMKRSQDISRQGSKIIGFVVIPITLQAIVTDLTAVGLKPFWMALRLGIIPVGLLAILSYRLAFIRKHPDVPLFAVIYYIAGAFMLFISETGYQDSLYYHSIIQLLFGLTLLPLGYCSFALVFGGPVLMFMALLLVHSGFDWSIFGHGGLLFFKTYLIIDIAIFFVTNRVRVNFYRKSIEMEDELVDRDRVIKTQVDELSQTANAAAIANAVQQIAHDLRSPIGVFERIIRARSWTEFESLCREGWPSLNRIHTLIDAFRQADMEKLVSRTWQPLDHTAVIGEAEVYAREKGVVFRKQWQPALKVRIDKPKLERSVLNLLRNAIESGASEVTLITWTEFESTVIIEVRDNGPGIASALCDNLFRRGATYGKESGTGLGLHYVRAVARGHGGDITHERDDGHTIFRIVLPYSLYVSEPEEELNLPKEGSPPCDLRPERSDAAAKILIALDRPEALAAFQANLAGQHWAQFSFDVDDLQTVRFAYTDSLAVKLRCIGYAVPVIDVMENLPADQVMARLKATALALRAYSLKKGQEHDALA